MIQFWVLVLIYDIWKCTPNASNGVNFAKDYQKDSYNQRIFIEKNMDDKNTIATLKKHSYFFNHGILRLKTLKECFKIVSIFLRFKSPLPHINVL